MDSLAPGLIDPWFEYLNATFDTGQVLLDGQRLGEIQPGDVVENIVQYPYPIAGEASVTVYDQTDGNSLGVTINNATAYYNGNEAENIAERTEINGQYPRFEQLGPGKSVVFTNANATSGGVTKRQHQWTTVDDLSMADGAGTLSQYATNGNYFQMSWVRCGNVDTPP